MTAAEKLSPLLVVTIDYPVGFTRVARLFIDAWEQSYRLTNGWQLRSLERSPSSLGGLVHAHSSMSVAGFGITRDLV